MLIATGPNQQEHFNNVKECLQILQENDLFVKPEKCTFFTTRIDLLGFIINNGTINMEQTKLKGILEWPVPSTLKPLKKFSRILQLLSSIYKRLCKSIKSIKQTFEENRTMELDQRPTKIL